MLIPKGHAGSWFAEWDGESLPCIHQHAIEGALYVDRGVNDHSAWPRFIAELRAKKRAILTTSHPAGDDGIRRRKSYVEIWEIGDVEVVEPTEESQGTMSFPMGRLLKRFRP